uniref:protein NLP7-like n=1 Tax=Erigeron canadensis TaxID=72917 RepID=UPI001CB9B8A2|nr:protein NLP7-like [Erigeron canadensis]
MDLHAKTVDSGDVYIYTGFGKIPLEPPTIPLSGDTRYLTQLWVSGKEVPHEELHQSDSSQSENTGTCFLNIPYFYYNSCDSIFFTGFRPGAESIVPSYQKTRDKIKSALKQLSFREQCVLVQFWSPDPAGKHQFLTTRDQPFGLGVIDDQGLCSYRKYSEHNPFFIDKDHQEYNLSPPLRVYMQGLPEWSSDLTNYSPEDFPLQDFAIRCNFHGYLALPVFDSTTRFCVGVLELLMSSKYTSYDYEVQQVHSVLKNENLTSPGTFGPTSMVSDVCRKIEMDKIYHALKNVCSIHRVPLAQTWAASPSASFVSREQAIWKSCDSFHTRCFGKVCLSTADLPFYVQDLGVWSFREASIECHLESSRGVVGRAFSTKDSYYCADVTKLSREEYPLVQNACISKLTGCFTIFLQNVESNNRYVLEFFLPRHVEGSRCMLNVVQTLKENLNAGFKLGDKSLIQAVGPQTDLSVHIKPDIIQTSSNWMADNFIFRMDSSCSEPSVTYIAGSDCANVASFTHTSTENSFAEFTDVVEQKDLLKDGMRKRDSRVVLPVTRKVKVKVTFRKIRKKFQFRISSGLSNLKNKVAKRFKLTGNMINLKYRDNENDLILIYDDADVVAALRASRSNDTINLTCVKIKV